GTGNDFPNRSFGPLMFGSGSPALSDGYCTDRHTECSLTTKARTAEHVPQAVELGVGAWALLGWIRSDPVNHALLRLFRQIVDDGVEKRLSYPQTCPWQPSALLEVDPKRWTTRATCIC